MPSPPEPEISLGNKESEALTAEQVLFEESITSLSAVGSCDDSVGEENRTFAQSIANGDFNFVRSANPGLDSSSFKSVAHRERHPSLLPKWAPKLVHKLYFWGQFLDPLFFRFMFFHRVSRK